MKPLQRKNVLCCLLFILSLILTQRVLTLQEMHRYFIVYEYLATKQKEQATSSELKIDGSGCP